MRRETLLKPLLALSCLFAALGVGAQNISVSGKVSDAEGPVVGAVVLSGKANAVTDVDGAYSINVPSSAVLEVSCLGYVSQEVPVNGRSTINITLVEDAEVLQEAVALGYGAQTKKKDLSASVGVVSNAGEIAARPVASASAMLQGQVAGVVVSSDGGSPTSGPSVLIRGQGSRNGDSVLWVVDGVPGGPIVSMSDVESIVVLKDAASAAALMSKVYAYWAGWDPSKWPEVITCVNRLEQSYGRDLHPSYSELFSCDLSKFWTKEYCWGMPSYGGKSRAGDGSMKFPGVCLENNGWSSELPAGMGYNGWGQFKPTLDLYEEMAKDNVEEEVKNERLSKSILEYGDPFTYFGQPFRFHSSSDVEAGFQIGKYMEAFEAEDCVGTTALDNEDWPCTRINWPIIRFADCMLLRAEAYLMAGDAASAARDINRIRERSHLKPIGSTATWTDLYHERRCELALEPGNDHAYDCKRWAVFGNSEIRELALNELNNHPRVRHYKNRNDPDSEYTVGPYKDYQSPVKVWKEKCLTFPYPSEQIAKSAGKLKNPPSWN